VSIIAQWNKRLRNGLGNPHRIVIGGCSCTLRADYLKAWAVLVKYLEIFIDNGIADPFILYELK